MNEGRLANMSVARVGMKQQAFTTVRSTVLSLGEVLHNGTSVVFLIYLSRKRVEVCITLAGYIIFILCIVYMEAQ